MNEIYNFFHQPRAIVLSAFIAILLLWVLSWEDGARQEPYKKTTLPHTVIHETHAHQFSFDSLINRMDTYYKLVVDNHGNKKLTKNQLESMLFAFQQERHRFYNHLNLIKKNKSPKISQRKERSLRHYLYSIESIITDLKKRINRMPKVGAQKFAQ